MSQHIRVALDEKRLFPPSEEFANAANVSREQYEKIFAAAKADPESYWAEAASELKWFRKWDQVLDWKAPNARWFVGGKINASYNCLDRHLETQPHKAAIVWEGEPGEVVVWTYSDLHSQVERMTAALRKLGLKPGDRVAIYLPNIPEGITAMLACARGGFTHTVVFAGFNAKSLQDRIQDAEAKVVITGDGCYRRGSWLNLKQIVDQAMPQCPSVQHVITVRRAVAGQISHESWRSFLRTAPFPDNPNRELDWHGLIAAISLEDRKNLGYAEVLDSEHPLYILYTSGTTGKPKGLVHTTGGYLTGLLRTMKTVFDIKSSDMYWCTADLGWVTGHSYVAYGPLVAGATLLLYEGAWNAPTNDRFWSMIERHRVTIFYTAPTAIRTFMRLGAELPRSRDLSSLRLLGSVGEPINPEAWIWYRDTIGGGHCPVVDTYWQTETGAIVVAPLPGVTSLKPGSATVPLPGYDVDVVDKEGKSVPAGSGGYLVIRRPWPAMARTIHGDPDRYRKTYWSEFAGQNYYFTGDGARRDEDGYIWALGRIDDVVNVSGHRIGTMEVESAIVAHPAVSEAAVVGRPDEIKGQALVAFVSLKESVTGGAAHPDEEALHGLADKIKAHVVTEIGAIARPDEIRFTQSLPKTRSGKIMRRLLCELATSGQVTGDTTTLEDLGVIAALQKDKDEE